MPAPREDDAVVLQHRQRALGESVAGVGEARRLGDAVLPALHADAAQLSRQVCERLLRHAHVITRVVADLEAVLVKLRDLVPRHVVFLVRCKVESFGDEECGAELKFREQRPCHREV